MAYTLHLRIIDGIISADKDYDSVFCHFTYNKTNYRGSIYYLDGITRTDGKMEQEFDLDVEDNTKGAIELFLANKTKFSEKDLAHLKIDFSSLKLGEKTEKMWYMKPCPDAHKVDVGRANMVVLMNKNEADSSGSAQSSERLNSLEQENTQLKDKSYEMERKINRLTEENKDFIRKQSSPIQDLNDSDSPRHSDDSDSPRHSDDSDSPRHSDDSDDYNSLLSRGSESYLRSRDSESYLRSRGSESYLRSRGSESNKRGDESQKDSDESLQLNNDKVKKENEEVTKSNERLKSENEKIQSENKSIQKDLDQLTKDNEQFKNEIKELGDKINSLKSKNAELAQMKKDADQKLADRIKELEETNEQLSTQNTKLQGKADYLNDENKLLMKHVQNFVSAALKAKENFNIKSDKE